MIQNEFPEKVVKETSIQFGEDCIKEFLEQYDIRSSDHLIFDEVICTKYCKEFIDSILLLKSSVASLWMAMGSEPVTGKYFFNHLIGCFVLSEWKASRRKEVGIPLGILRHIWEQNKRCYFPRPGQS